MTPRKKFQDLVESVGELLPGRWYLISSWDLAVDVSLVNAGTGVAVEFKISDRRQWGPFRISIASLPGYELDARTSTPEEIARSIEISLEHARQEAPGHPFSGRRASQEQSENSYQPAWRGHAWER